MCSAGAIKPSTKDEVTNVEAIVCGGSDVINIVADDDVVVAGREVVGGFVADEDIIAEPAAET